VIEYFLPQLKQLSDPVPFRRDALAGDPDASMT